MFIWLDKLLIFIKIWLLLLGSLLLFFVSGIVSVVFEKFGVIKVFYFGLIR